MTRRLAAWPFHAILAAGAAVCWSTAAAWVAAVLTGLLAVTGTLMEAIARRHRGQAMPAPRRVRCRADVIRGVTAPGTARKALTAGAIITERKDSR